MSAQGFKVNGTALASTHLSDSAALARLASPTFTGAPAAPTPAGGDNSTKLATTAFVATSFAPLNSPALTGTPVAPTPGAADNSTKIATTAFVTAALGSAISSGAVMMHAGASAPTGWLLCDGSAVSRATFAALFAVVSTTYGVGDGSTTFNVPDMRGRVPVGLASGGKTAVNALGKNDGLIATLRSIFHHHTYNTFGQNQGGSTAGGQANAPGAFYIAPATTGDADNTDAPAYLVLNYIIKT